MISNKEKYINLSTQKIDGTFVNTPVWFVKEDKKNIFYVFSAGEAGKVKRIKNGLEIISINHGKEVSMI